MMKYFLLVFLLPFSVCFLTAQSSVYKITKDKNVMYLGGTIHILQKEDYPLPIEFEKAYKKSDILVFEADIKEMNDPSFTNRILQDGYYKEDKSLETELSEKTFDMLLEVCKENSIPMELINKMKPSLAIMTITMFKLQKMGFTEEGIDLFYSKKAIEDEKELFFLESGEEQLNMLLVLGEGDNDAYIEYSLRDINKLETSMSEIKDAWLIGDRKIMKKQNDQMKKEFPSIYKTLLLHRNYSWMIHLEKMLETKEVEFVLVGALHLYGVDGILSLLEKKDYQIEQLKE